jgi:hypothetical protein
MNDMTIEELIENFEAQQIKTKMEIEKLKETLTDREEYLVKLIGGVEALKLYKDQENLSIEEGA